MRSLYLILMFCATVIAANAQTITGTVVDENQKPMEFVNIVLHTIDSVFIEGATTDNSGKFQLNKNSDTLIKRLTFSYIGYQTKTINVVGGNTGEIMLLPDAVALKESVVIGSNTVLKDGKRIVTPTSEQLEKSPTGFILLDNIRLPRLDVDITQNSISVFGGGSAVLLINGREADREEIIALDSKTIKNIEYSDMPTARFAGAAVIVNFVVDEPQKGGAFATDLTNGLTMIYGEDVLSLKLYNGASQFSIWYLPQFRDLKSQWRENEETFNLSGGTINRKELGEPARFRYLVNNIRLRYNYFKNDRMFDVSLSGEITNFPNSDFKSKLVTNTSSDTLFMTDNSRNTEFTPRLRLYYQEPLGKNQFLYASISGGYAKRNYKRDYQELLNDNTVENYFYSDVDEKQQTYNASLTYENNINFEKSGYNLSIDGNIRHSYSTTKNIYNNVIKNTSTEIDVHTSRIGTSAALSKDRSSYYVGGILYRNYHSVDNISVANYNLYIGASARQALSEKSSLYAYIMISSNQIPSLSNLSNVDQFIDSLQIRRGNPNLVNPKQHMINAAYELETSKLFFIFETKYFYTAKPIMETSFLEGDYIIRTVENHKNFKKLVADIYINTDKLWNFISFNIITGISKYSSNGNTYKHTQNIFFARGRINFFYKKWQLTYQIWNKMDDDFWGETLTQGEGGDKITLFYVTPKFYIGIGCFNPVLAQSRMNTKTNYSLVAPYKRYEYMDNFKRGKGIFVRFVKTFRWGKQKDDVNVNASDAKSESAIMKGDK
ncbi:MAG: carboxypeptidase-like regulatory domain-containing protein [Prevotellaceae bacterium]|nr:carboxypeptidase-like regulatory domain-containing protein [Prevotellaceae bacterium]